MPNVKVHVDEQIWTDKRADLKALLVKLRSTIMTEFSAPQSVCHLTILPCIGLSDQATVLVDIHYLAMPERTPELAEAAAKAVRTLFVEEIGIRPDVRAISLAADSYVALR